MAQRKAFFLHFQVLYSPKEMAAPIEKKLCHTEPKTGIYIFFLLQLLYTLCYTLSNAKQQLYLYLNLYFSEQCRILQHTTTLW
jgi:hypothetical protein